MSWKSGGGGSGGSVSVTKASIGLGNVTNDAQVKRSEMGVAGGVATLDPSTGKVYVAQMPIGIVTVAGVANQTARLALPKSTNLMIALQADTTNEWMINANADPAVAANWIDCGSYASKIISVNGQTAGAITIDLASLNGVPKTTTVNGKALSTNITLAIGDIITLNGDSSSYIGGDGTLHQLPTSTSMNDKSTNGYFDIGNMRVQWGRVVTGASGSETVTLPIAFANNTYSTTVTMLATQAMVVGMIYSQTTTNFTVRKVFYNTGGVFGSAGEWFNWIAIGLKP
jgi:hypothetical protein